MVGCVSMPVDDRTEATKQNKVVITQPVVASNQNQIKQIDKQEDVRVGEPIIIDKKLIQVESQNQENQIPVPIIKNNVKPDPSVSLIAPPTNLPQTVYNVPEVEGKENFTPTTKKYVNKKVCKNGKCVTKRVSVSVGKTEKSKAKVTSKKTTTTKKTTKSTTTKTKVQPKKDTLKK
jgi:hypothetical protein